MNNRRCSPSGHEELKRSDSEFPKLPHIGTAPLGDVILEYRNCVCGSTLVRVVGLARTAGEA